MSKMRTGQIIQLSLAAIILGAAPAGAADLKPPPQRNTDTPMLACPEYGAGFLRLPGHDVCLKASIDVTFEMKIDAAKQDIRIETARTDNEPYAYYYKLKLDRSADRLTMRIDPRINFMTVSRVGDNPLITFTSFRTGQMLTAANGRTNETSSSEHLQIDQAWIKYLGFTAGKHPSFFNFSPGYTYSGGYASQTNLNLFAYTHTFGKTASLSLAVEDANERRTEDGVWSAYGGQRMPDIVAQARYLPSWGIVHAAAALHEIPDSIGITSSLAYAASAGIEVRQKWADMFGAAAADTYGRFLLNGAYTNGALSYLAIPKFGTDYITDADGKIRKTRGYSAVASYEHVWKPNFKTTLSYSVYAINSDLPNFDMRVRGSLAQVGAEYMPVPGLMVGTELNYFRDSVRTIHFGVPADRDKVEIFTGYAYIRRRI